MDGLDKRTKKKGTNEPRDKGTKGQMDKGTKGQREKVTKGRRDRGEMYILYCAGVEMINLLSRRTLTINDDVTMHQREISRI